MIKLIQRTTDNKYLQSIENDIWVDNIKDAFEMTYRECEEAKTALNGVLLPEQLKVIVDMRKYKPISKEEKQELLNLLRK
jgi:hypothetical protein